jgi:hypothetical protein
MGRLEVNPVLMNNHSDALLVRRVAFVLDIYIGDRNLSRGAIAFAFFVGCAGYKPLSFGLKKSFWAPTAVGSL